MGNTSNVNFGVRFTTKAKAVKKNYQFKDKIFYNTRDEVYVNKDTKFLPDNFKSNQHGYLTRDETVKLHKETFNDYKTTNRIMYFDSHGAVRENDNKRLVKNAKELDHIQNKYANACLYESYTSFDKQFAKKNIINKYSEEEIVERVKPYINDLFKENGFEPSNVQYYLNFHTNRDHLHFHLDFIEKYPTREKNALELNTLGNFRKNLMLEFDNDLKEQYEYNIDKIRNQKDELRNTISTLTVDSIIEDKLKKAVIEYQKKPVPYYNSVTNPILKNLVQEIREDLFKDNPSNKKLVYDYLSFETTLDKQEELNKENYGKSNRSQKDNQLNEVNMRLNNQIFRLIKKEAKKEYKQNYYPGNTPKKEFKRNPKITANKFDRLGKNLAYIAREQKRIKDKENDEYLQSVIQENKLS